MNRKIVILSLSAIAFMALMGSFGFERLSAQGGTPTPMAPMYSEGAPASSSYPIDQGCNNGFDDGAPDGESICGGYTAVHDCSGNQCYWDRHLPIRFAYVVTNTQWSSMSFRCDYDVTGSGYGGGVPGDGYDSFGYLYRVPDDGWVVQEENFRTYPGNQETADAPLIHHDGGPDAHYFSSGTVYTTTPGSSGSCAGTGLGGCYFTGTIFLNTYYPLTHAPGGEVPTYYRDGTYNAQCYLCLDCIAQPITMSVPCGIVQDYHFVSPTSWQGSAGATWASHAWTLRYGAMIQQNIGVTATMLYTIEISAKGAGATVGILVDSQNIGDITIDESGVYETYSTAVYITSGSHQFQLTSNGEAMIDWVCVLPTTNLLGTGPCNITASDMLISKRYYVSNAEMDGLSWPAVVINGWGFPLNPGIAFYGGYDPFNWSYAGDIGVAGHHGVYETHESGNPDLGVIPEPLHHGILGLFSYSTPSEFNVVLRMKRKYDNAQLSVGGVNTCPTSPNGEWVDASAFLPAGADRITISSDCNGTWCSTPATGSGTLDTVEIDDVYIVPGPDLQCCVTTPITVPMTPLGDCINPNPGFLDGSDSWSVYGGATIETAGSGGWARLPAGGYIEQDVTAASNSSPWGTRATGVVVGSSYVIAVGAHLDSAGAPGQFSVIVGASTPGQQTFNHQVVTNPSVESTDEFSATQDMIGSGADPTLRIRVLNESGGTVLIDYVCLRFNGTGTTGPLPPYGACLGTWLTDAGQPAIGAAIPANNYIRNDQSQMYGSYTLDVAGTMEHDTNELSLNYANPTTGRFDSAGNFSVVGTEFGTSFTFVVPPGGWYAGQLRIDNADSLTYENICLRSGSNSPTQPPPAPPGSLPYPECGSVNSPFTNTTSFYMLSPYSITSEYTGTVPAYVAELTYNYAIYPLVCTTISIGNWQYRAFSSFMTKFNSYVTMVQQRLDTIISILEDILDRLNQLPPTCGILDVILWLFKEMFKLFVAFVKLLFQMVNLFIKIFSAMMGQFRNESAVAYPFNCGSDDGRWVCFALAGVLSMDNQIGDWLNIIAGLVCAMLTVSLVFWVVGQIRDMLQPGSGGGDHAD